MEDEASLRLIIFGSMLGAMVVLEGVLPRRRDIRRNRWISNIGIVVIDTLVVRFLMPAGAIGAALYAEVNQVGVFYLIELPTWLEILLAYLLLDMAIYFQHRIFHAVPMFWRLHRVHHSDVGFDVTTALRFHPVEILLSLLIKIVLILMLGAPVLAVLIFEVLLSSTAMFNHANIGIPQSLDRVVRLILVTPDMHRVHHSIHKDETDSNFGFNVPWWDRLFGTYTPQPRGGHLEMTIGIDEFRSSDQQRLDRLLLQPFVHIK